MANQKKIETHLPVISTPKSSEVVCLVNQWGFDNDNQMIKIWIDKEKWLDFEFINYRIRKFNNYESGIHYYVKVDNTLYRVKEFWQESFEGDVRITGNLIKSIKRKDKSFIFDFDTKNSKYLVWKIPSTEELEEWQ